jgi:hypothetical protein
MSVVSSPIRTGNGMGSPGFRSQRKMSAGTIMKKIQTLEDTIESLRQQLVFTRSEEEQITNIVSKKNIQKEPKKTKEPKETKEKMPAAAKQKKITAAASHEEKEKDKIPMPWTGVVDFSTCVGLKAQYGLFIQCGKECDMSSGSFQIDNHECRFCNDCVKKCDEDGKHPVGTMEERIEAGVGKYVNAKTGKKETIYIEVLEKMGITKEQALESAAKRGFQIPDWMFEKVEKKRGRPVSSTATTTTATGDANASSTDNFDSKIETKKTKEKEKKTRQPHTKKTAKVTVQDTPEKKDSVQSSICVDLNACTDHQESVTPTANDVVNVAAQQEKEKKKRGRPAKSNTQNNVGESEMQTLIIQATTEKKKRLSIDPSDLCLSPSQIQKIAPQNTENVQSYGEVKQHKQVVENDEDMIFDMFDKMIEAEQQEQKQQVEEKEHFELSSSNEKKNEKSKKTKKSDNNDGNVQKVKDGKIAKKEAAATKKKQEEEAALAAAAASAAAKKKQDEEKNYQETEEDETENDEEEEELECEEYEYDGETYGLAPNGDIYSQDGNLVGKLTNGVPKMFN